MLPYAGIASVLQEAGSSSRGERAQIIANFIKRLPFDELCPCIRLISGQLWPSWEEREMGVGPEAVLNALEEVSSENVRIFYQRWGELGSVAEVALQHRSQYPISVEPLNAAYVYRMLRRISEQSGPESEGRKRSVLRGLFLDASPLEGKYIARTALKNMRAGLGPHFLAMAISLAFNQDPLLVKAAFSKMPDMGMVALAASKSELERISIQPPIPLRPMLMRYGEKCLPGAYGIKYPGLRVQVHKVGSRFFIYTLRLKNITGSLRCLEKEVLNLEHDFISEAWLIGHQHGQMLDRPSLIRYINRRQLSRRKNVSPCLMAFDLISLDGEDLTGIRYAERRRCLTSLLGKTRESALEDAFVEITGNAPARILLAGERLIEGSIEAEDYCRQSLGKGFDGLVYRDLDSIYTPGEWSKTDSIIRLKSLRGCC